MSKMRPGPIHVIDLDDVICDCVGPLMTRRADATGRHVSPDEFRGYHRMHRLYGISRAPSSRASSVPIRAG